MNILLINHYAGSTRHGMTYRPFYLAREWVKLGHRVAIVAASHSHLRQQAPAVRGEFTEEDLEGIRYIWLKTPEYERNGVRRAWNILSFVWRLFRYQRWLARKIAPDVVIASSTYPLDNYPALRLANRCGAKLVYEVRDLWPLTPIEVGGMSPRHPFIILLQRAENFAYRNADRVVSLLPKAEAYMRQHGMASGKFVHVPNGIDVAEWQAATRPLPQPHADLLRTLNQKNRFIVGYAGGHGTANALDALLEAAGRLEARPVTLVLVGDGPEKQRLQRKARQLGLTNTAFLPPVPKPSVPALLASMDALYIGWLRKPLYRFGVSPNKLIDYMIAAKPVIHAIDAGNDLVAQTKCGLSIPSEDPHAIALAVCRLMASTPAEREAMGRRGSRHVRAHHDYSVLARRFLEALASRAAQPCGQPLSRAA
jgi:glycosyltransferase involved in cell wall biosynthesis